MNSTRNYHTLGGASVCTFKRHGFHSPTAVLGLLSAERGQPLTAQDPDIRKTWSFSCPLCNNSHELIQRQILCDKLILKGNPGVRSQRRGLKELSVNSSSGKKNEDTNAKDKNDKAV